MAATWGRSAAARWCVNSTKSSSARRWAWSRDRSAPSSATIWWKAPIARTRPASMEKGLRSEALFLFCRLWRRLLYLAACMPPESSDHHQAGVAACGCGVDAHRDLADQHFQGIGLAGRQFVDTAGQDRHDRARAGGHSAGQRIQAIAVAFIEHGLEVGPGGGIRRDPAHGRGCRARGVESPDFGMVHPQYFIARTLAGVQLRLRAGGAGRVAKHRAAR